MVQCSWLRSTEVSFRGKGLPGCRWDRRLAGRAGTGGPTGNRPEVLVLLCRTEHSIGSLRRSCAPGAGSGGPRMPILEVRGLVKYYGRRKVVDGVDFDVDAGEVVGLLGPNGAGKTTSFRMTTGQITPNEGRVTFDGRDVTRLPMYRRARLGMGYLSQETSVFRKLSVEQNVLAILEMLPLSRSLGRRLTRKERWQRTETMLGQFGL